MEQGAWGRELQNSKFKDSMLHAPCASSIMRGRGFGIQCRLNIKNTTGGLVRIIAGKFRGRRLHTPRGLFIRPTADRNREAIFNILGSQCRGRLVVDLFAGTGALGLEALSRGADQVAFIDNRRAALDVIRRNINACGCDASAMVFSADINRGLGCLKRVTRPAEMVFMDPPYRQGLINTALHHLHTGDFIASEARLIIEHSTDDTLPDHGEIYRIDDQRRYGKTLVSFLTYVI